MNDEVTNYLSSLYGTEVQGQDDGEDLEKLAALEVLGNYADHLGIDISDVDFSEHTSDDIKEAIDELEKTASYDDDGDEQGLPEELEQFDLAGRVMAHAFWQEREKIAWLVGEKGVTTAELLKERRGAAAAKGMRVDGVTKRGNMTAKSVAEDLKKKRKAYYADKGANGPNTKIRTRGRGNPNSFGPHLTGEAPVRGGKTKYVAPRGGGFKAYAAAERDVQKAAGPGMLSRMGSHLRRHKGKYGVGAAALGGLGVLAAMRNKNSSMIDEIAAQRLEELLEENGYDKTAGYDPVEEAIEARMAEMAEELGYEID